MRLGLLLLSLLGVASPALAQSLTLLTMEPGIVGQTSQFPPFFPMTGYGTYTGTAPSSATGTWTGCGDGSATVRFFLLNPYPNTTFPGTTGTYTVGVAAPSTPGVGCTLTITTDLATSATSPPTTVVTFPSGGTVVSNIHNAPGWVHSQSYTPASGPKTRVNNGPGWTESSGTWNPGSLLRAYELTSGSCTSAASGGPTGTGSSISDGTCTWKYLSDTDYITLSGFDLDAPAWSSGRTYTYGEQVVTNTGGFFRSYWLDTITSLLGNPSQPAAFCTSTVAPSGTGTRVVLADGCSWTYVGDVIYSSGASNIPFNTYQSVNATVFSGIKVTHLSRSYQASMWNDREYLFGSNGENYINGLSDHVGGGHCCGGESGYISCYTGGNVLTLPGSCPTVIFQPAAGEGFASSLTTSTPLTGYDPTKGVAVRRTNGPGFLLGDMNLRVNGLQIKSDVSDGLQGFNNEIITNSIIDGGYVGQNDGTAVWLDVPDIVANNLVINHGAAGIAFKYGSSIALFNTIVNVGSVATASCINYQWAWVWSSLIAANNACYNFPHSGAYDTGEGPSNNYIGVFDASSKNNVTTTPVGADYGNVQVVTFTNGSADIGWPSNTLTAGTRVEFGNNGGSLPTNFTEGTTYFVIATGLSSSNVQVSATAGGSAIVAGSAGSGVSTGYGSGVAIDGGKLTGGTPMPMPNSTYGASGAAMFVSPGSDWRPGSALIGAGASYGTFSWGCPSSGPCTPASLNYDSPDLLASARPSAGSWTVGAEQAGGVAAYLRMRWLGMRP